uniref:Peptidase S1 domain-containing protein n=1 Tax=Pundamilia nyererei TaxID=303518 RepID=A0A3B4FN08_9CICH
MINTFTTFLQLIFTATFELTNHHHGQPLLGDSGGPLVCPAGSEGHRSPGIFTDVRLLLPWIKRKLREGRF